MTRASLILGAALALGACHTSLPLNDAGFVCGLAGNPCGSATDCCAGLLCKQGGCAFPIGSAPSGGGTTGGLCQNPSSCSAGGSACCPGYACLLDVCVQCELPGTTCSSDAECCAGSSCLAGYCVFDWQSGCDGGSAGTGGSGTGGGSSTSGGTSGGGDAGCPCGQVCALLGDPACLCDPRGGCVQCLSDADCGSLLCDTQPGDPNYGVCVSGCTSSSQCDGGVCDLTSDSCLPDCRAPGFPGCSASGPICDPATGLCVACLTTANCTGGLRCSPQNHQCVSCLSWADCPYDVSGCLNGNCGGCATAADCPPHDGCSSSGFCYCNDDQGCGGDVPVCVSPGGNGTGISSGCGCTDSSQCCGASVVCAPATTETFGGRDANGACRRSCTLDGCRGDLCNPANGVCQRCLVDADCGSGFCDGGACVNCSIDADCASLDAGTPFCAGGSCVGCLSYTQCPPSAPGCSRVTWQCGSCSDSADCPPGTGCLNAGCAPFCGLGGASQGCPPCRSNADCEGASCNPSTGFCG
ncbi:MAG: hypothetical protein ACYDCL_10215 [Myxococcales bacterium]